MTGAKGTVQLEMVSVVNKGAAHVNENLLQNKQNKIITDTYEHKNNYIQDFQYL